jgi:hypothetical protein
MDLKEIFWENMYWIYLAHRGKWRAVMEMEKNHQFPEKQGQFDYLKTY